MNPHPTVLITFFETTHYFPEANSSTRQRTLRFSTVQSLFVGQPSLIAFDYSNRNASAAMKVGIAAVSNSLKGCTASSSK